MSLEYYKSFIYDNFVKLVQYCDLQTILQAERCTFAHELLKNIQFTDDKNHNNRVILFEILSLECTSVVGKFVEIFRTALTRLQNISNNNIDIDNLKITVRKSKKFYDTDEYNKTKYYRTRSRKRGRVLIVNNIDFEDGPKRQGAIIDEENLCELFKQLNFEIVSYRNLKWKEMCDFAQNFANGTNMEQPDICFVILMSHGSICDNKTVILATDNVALPEDWFLQLFNNENCLYFKNIPKIFIFHVCRDFQRPIEQQTDQSEANLEIGQNSERIFSDMIVCHPTVEGSMAGRDPSKGCWYIQLICKIFMDYAHELDVQSLLQKVDEELEHYNADGHRQTSTFKNIAFKNCYLHPGIYENCGKLCKFID